MHDKQSKWHTPPRSGCVGMCTILLFQQFCAVLLIGHQVIYDWLWSHDSISHQCKCQQIIDSLSHDSIEYGWNLIFYFIFFKLLWFINVFQFSLLIPINAWYPWPWACRNYNWILIFFSFLWRRKIKESKVCNLVGF